MWRYALLITAVLCVEVPFSVAQEPRSPTIRAIVGLPARARAEAARVLIDSLKQSGGPLVEPYSDSMMVVTFLWQDGGNTESAVVITPSTLYDFDASIMTRIDETPVWYNSRVLFPSTRFAYRFEIDGPLVPFDEDPRFFDRMPTWRRDPTNSRTFVYETGDTASVLELEAAPDARWSRERMGGPTGAIRRTIVQSAFLAGQRPVWVYRPPGYHSTSSALPLLVLTDGGTYLDVFNVDRILDNLINRGRIPPILAVGVTSPNRREDLGCNPRFGDFIALELLPWLAKREHLTIHPDRVVIGGYSLGGLAAACAAVGHPRKIGTVLAQSGSFQRRGLGEGPAEGVARALSKTERHPLRFRIDVGMHERGPLFGGDPSTLTANRHLRDVLVARGYDVVYTERASGHEPVAWRENLHLGLISAFSTGGTEGADVR